MGYLGILRNLRNLIIHDVDTDDIVGRIADPERARKSSVFPFQFYSAYRAMDNFRDDTRDFRETIGGVQAPLHARLQRVPRARCPEFVGRTAIFCDNSGSMTRSIHPKSNITFREIANLYGIILANRSDEPFLYLHVARRPGNTGAQ